MNRADVILVRFPHPSGVRGKKRPAVVVQSDAYAGTVSTLVVAEVTTNKAEKKRWEPRPAVIAAFVDVIIADWSHSAARVGRTGARKVITEGAHRIHYNASYTLPSQRVPGCKSTAWRNTMTSDDRFRRNRDSDHSEGARVIDGGY